MTNPISSAVAGDTALAASGQQDPAKLKESAKQFESLLIAQMMRSMRECSSGWLGSGEDATAAPAMEMAEESFAQSLASSGGLGLAGMITRGLHNEDQQRTGKTE
jgi:Rod binding domain-containing protein